MRVWIDGNILLDVLQNRPPHVTDSAAVWKLCEAGETEGCVSALTFANLVYVMRKELTPETIVSVFDKLCVIFRFQDLSVSDLSKAAAMQWRDFEDAVQTAAAERIGADYIITRNLKDFEKSTVPCVSPASFLELFRAEAD